MLLLTEKMGLDSLGLGFGNVKVNLGLELLNTSELGISSFSSLGLGFSIISLLGIEVSTLSHAITRKPNK